MKITSVFRGHHLVCKSPTYSGVVVSVLHIYRVQTWLICSRLPHRLGLLLPVAVVAVAAVCRGWGARTPVATPPAHTPHNYTANTPARALWVVQLEDGVRGVQISHLNWATLEC